MLVGKAGRSDDDVNRVTDRPADVVHHGVGVGEIDHHLDLSLENRIELVGDRHLHLREADERADGLTDVFAVYRGDECEFRISRYRGGDHPTHLAAGTYDSDPYHFIAPSKSLFLKGPMTASDPGCEKTRFATRLASSKVTASIRLSI